MWKMQVNWKGQQVTRFSLTCKSRGTQTLSSVWLAPGPILTETLLRAVRSPITARASNLVTGWARKSRVAAANIWLDAGTVETGAFQTLSLAEVVIVRGVSLATAGVVHHTGYVFGLVSSNHFRRPLSASSNKQKGWNISMANFDEILLGGHGIWIFLKIETIRITEETVMRIYIIGWLTPRNTITQYPSKDETRVEVLFSGIVKTKLTSDE